MNTIVIQAQIASANGLNACEKGALWERLEWLFEQSRQALQAGNLPVAMQSLGIARELTGSLYQQKRHQGDPETYSLFQELHHMIVDYRQLIGKMGEEGAFLLQVLAEHCCGSLGRRTA